MISALPSHQLSPENGDDSKINIVEISSNTGTLPAAMNMTITHDGDVINKEIDDVDVTGGSLNDNHTAIDDDACDTGSQVNVEEEGDAQIYMPCSTKCKVCCALPFCRSTKDDESEGILWDDASPWDWDGGLYDLVCQLNGRDQYPRLPADIAKVTVEATTKHLALLKDQLMTDGLQHQYNQNYCGESLSSSRIIAPFDFSELELGQLLGNGGFSSVSEITCIRPNSRSPKQLNVLEERSRHYVANNIICKIEKTSRTPGPKKLSDSSTGKSDKSRDRSGQYCTQYAVKHLRNRLVTRTPEKFKRAAIDLVLEGQLLLFLDHPNIVALHGWCGDGPQAFASGDPRGFFLMLDKLPVSLEERLGDWRNCLIKYQRQLKRQVVAQQRSQTISNWARRTLRLRRNQIEDAISIAPTTKAALAIQNLLVERLIVVRKIGLAIQYMHSKRLIHRDLKVSNVGFDIYGEVKLFDFGLSRLLPNTSDQYISSIRSNGIDCGESTSTFVTGSISEIYVMSRVGTKFYMAPEVRRKEPYSLPADVYSFGVILWEVLTLSTPREFYHHERDRVSKLAKESGVDNLHDKDVLSSQGFDRSKSWLPICPCWPVGIKELVTACLSSDSIDRPTMEQILVILQHHIDELSAHSTTADTSSTGTIKSELKPRSCNFRVNLSSVDLRYLDKRDSQ